MNEDQILLLECCLLHVQIMKLKQYSYIIAYSFYQTVFQCKYVECELSLDEN